jgi:phosphinothricin acetyltransferase
MTAIVRMATEADVPAILDIYNHEVVHGVSTFDLEPRTLEDRLEWYRRTQEHPHVVIVAEEAGEVVGWGCLHQFHARAAYRFTTEDSVYIHQDHRGKGLGKLILARLVQIARENGFHSVMAGVSQGNPVSVRLHEGFGFEAIGVQRQVGYKFERWLDVSWFQLMLEGA